jgi:transcription initiation factor TFIIIB Brf1 subunit/transcription initiation factor TFIIB
MFDKCPGALDIRTPTLTLKPCPECGEEIEIFSNDLRVVCSSCGCVIFNDMVSCIKWCKYAKECVGEELYNSLTKDTSPRDQK